MYILVLVLFSKNKYTSIGLMAMHDKLQLNAQIHHAILCSVGLLHCLEISGPLGCCKF
jgi:hypothetical protein